MLSEGSGSENRNVRPTHCIVCTHTATITSREEYKTFVQEVGYETAATLSPDHWGILKSIKQDLCDDPNDNLVPDHTIGRHYFPEISLGPDLVATDFPAVSNSWTHRAFESSKTQTTVDGIHGRPLRGSKAIKEENRNVMMTYIQDKNGVPADGDTAKAIRRRAAELFHTIATLREDDVPSTWGQVDSNCKDFYRAKICQFWPDLRMCAFNWKADAIASVVYAKWYPQFQGTQHLPADQEEVQGGKRKRQRQDVHPPASPSPLLSQSSSQLQEPVPSPSPPLPPTSPMEEEAPSTMTNPSTDTPFIDDPLYDVPHHSHKTPLTSHLFAVLTAPPLGFRQLLPPGFSQQQRQPLPHLVLPRRR